MVTTKHLKRTVHDPNDQLGQAYLRIPFTPRLLAYCIQLALLSGALSARFVHEFLVESSMMVRLN